MIGGKVRLRYERHSATGTRLGAHDDPTQTRGQEQQKKKTRTAAGSCAVLRWRSCFMERNL